MRQKYVYLTLIYGKFEDVWICTIYATDNYKYREKCDVYCEMFYANDLRKQLLLLPGICDVFWL